MQTEDTEMIIQGTAGSPGIAFGPVHVVVPGFTAPDIYRIPKSLIPTEIERFNNAIESTKKQLQELHNHIEQLAGDGSEKIFEAHIMVLEDKSLLTKVNDAITKREQNAEYAFYAVMKNFLESLRRLNDEYFKERASDLDDVCQRVLKNFQHGDFPEEPDGPSHQHIIVAPDLSPSDTAMLDRNQVLGFATEQGSINSHTAILARSLGIPAVVGLQNALVETKTLTPSILDGYTGKLILNPKAETTAKYQEKADKKRRIQEKLQELREKKTTTSDGHPITLATNIEFTHELPMIAQSGAEGIGLFRTEFYLLEGNELPDEDQQTKVYEQVSKATVPHQAIIRTLDAGGDKLPAEHLSRPEPNPFLGWRGIRVSLSRKGMFKEQLRAILRASAHGKLGMMFPMISGLREVLTAKEMLKRCMDELHQEGIPFDEKIQMGVMIEIPSAAMMAGELAKEVDFFSIGTNDLIQYTVAVDRINNYVAHLYKPTHPAVMRLMDITVKAAKDNGIWAGVCGEMASDLILTPLLVGLGVDELSVGPHKLPSIKKAICSLSQEDCSEMMQEALRAKSSPDILKLSQNMAKIYYPELLD